MNRSREEKIVAVAAWITILLLAALWIRYFLYPSSLTDTNDYRFTFDTTSPLPDLIFAVALATASILLWKDRESSRPVSLLCALYLVYLGVLDVGIPIGKKIYALSIIDITTSGALNLWCIVMGLYAIIRLRKPRSLKTE